MKLSDIISLAWSNLTHRKVRSWLTLLGIFAGIAAIVALISLGQGLQGAVTDQFSSMGVNTITIQGAGSSYGPPGTNAVGKLTEDDVRLLEGIQGVDDVFGRFIIPTVLVSQDIEETAFAASVPGGRSTEKIIEMMGVDIENGRMIDNFRDDDQIVIGGTIKFDDRKPEVGEKITIQDKTFRIAGTLKKKGNPMFDNVVLMTENKMKEFFMVEDDFSMVIVIVEDDADPIAVQSELTRKLRRDRGQKLGEEDFTVSTPQESLEALNEILLIVQILLVGIAAISLVVGAIGIANTMYTSVLERRREIGVMKAIGATNSDILGIFLFESGLLGLVGGIIGLALGVIISKGVEFGAQLYLGENLLKASIPGWLIIGALAVAFIIGATSGTLPARQAAKLDPVDSIRQ